MLKEYRQGSHREDGDFMRYTEADFQEGRIVGFFTENLKWKEGNKNQIDTNRWIIPSDLEWFLSQGNATNARSFGNLLKGYKSSSELVDEFIDQKLLPRLTNSGNAVAVLKGNIEFKGQNFSLFNDPPIVGGAVNAEEMFDKNAFKVIQEATFKRKFAGKDFNRRPDLTFFINGIYWGYSELKLSMKGQTASNEGREKIAHNFIEAVTMSIEDVLVEEKHLGGMPSWSELTEKASIKHKIYQNVALFAKAVHITAVDDSRLYIINDIEKFVPEIYNAMRFGMNSSQSVRMLGEILPRNIKRAFQKMPELRDQTPSQSVMTHLACLYDRKDGIYPEIEYFHSSRDGKIIRPRSAQRAMFFSVKNKVTSLYNDELTPKFSPEKIQSALLKSIPNISPEELSYEVDELLKLKNGQDQHSILLQGAAGLGKTHLIVWMAYELASMYHPAKLDNHNQEKLFDTIVVLTDRTELRKNIAKDATKTLAVEAKTTPELVEAIKGNQRIVIYNIQKTAGLKNALSQDLKDDLATKRIAFIIDEVHRSQNGKLNDDTMELFEACSSAQITDDKRNLIIGLTATPTEDILAKYGEWKPTVSPLDHRNFLPYFSYTMKEAIDDGYILDPTQNIITINDRLAYSITTTVDSKMPSTESIYLDPERQRLASRKIARIFVGETMNAIRPEHGPNSGRGEGKAIVVEYSINIAVQMKPLIEEALQEEADRIINNIPDGASKKTIEQETNKAEAVRNIAVTMVFSDTQEQKCSRYNDGLSEDAIIKKFRCENSPHKNSIMIVVDKLLTGFDETTLHTIFINKNMNGVSLFQAICRVNRIHDDKKDCLVVDLSHENTVAQAIPDVFRKYGGVTISDFDALTLEQKLKASYRYLFENERNRDISEYYKLWKTWNEEAKIVLPAEFTDKIDALFFGSEADIEKGYNIWKNCNQWLKAYEKLKYLLDFSNNDLRKHASFDKQKFIGLLKTHLYSKIREAQENHKDQIKFTVLELEETYGTTIIESKNDEEDKEASKKKASNKNERGTASASSAMDVLGRLIENEEKKEQLFKEIKHFMKNLFKIIDLESQKHNNNSFCKKIKNGDDMSWEEKITDFKRLYSKAISGRNKITLSATTPLYYKTLIANFHMNLLEIDYRSWVLGESSLHDLEETPELKL